ncbi:hypothetical protein [Actinomadura miaoliensis]|uniref:Uncharacterized protein n=1 Tax=Actinomadura miaoliensis TaxID=430685 RepID=A0ABP7X0F9_9ACTN
MAWYISARREGTDHRVVAVAQPCADRPQACRALRARLSKILHDFRDPDLRSAKELEAMLREQLEQVERTGYATLPGGLILEVVELTHSDLGDPANVATSSGPSTDLDKHGAAERSIESHLPGCPYADGVAHDECSCPANAVAPAVWHRLP